jgi:DNA-binding IclR family transcriptional regulator
MKERTLVTQRLYFGMSALSLRAATTRVMTRIAGIPPEFARVSARNLRQDFGMNTVAGDVLVEGFVARGLLEPRTEQRGDYRLTKRFLEFATARVVDPLPRSRAKELLSQACELATRINAECTRNPLEIEVVAPFGKYLNHDAHLSALELGVVVQPRAPLRRALGPVHDQVRGRARHTRCVSRIEFVHPRPAGQRQARPAAPIRGRVPARLVAPTTLFAAALRSRCCRAIGGTGPQFANGALSMR